jgi:hypothetical protein
LANSETEKKGVHQKPIDNLSSAIITSESSIIPVEAVHSNKDSPLASFLLSTNYILPLSLLFLLLLISILVSAGVCRYLRMHKGTSYITHEAAKDTLADTGGQQGLYAKGLGGERRREMIA